MNEYIVLKNSKGIKKVKNYNLEMNKPYIPVKIDGILTISDIRIYKKNIKNRKEILINMNRVLELLLLDVYLREDYMELLQNCKSKEDVYTFVNKILDGYKSLENHSRFVLKYLEIDDSINKNLICNMFIKKFLLYYFLLKFKSCSREKLENYIFDKNIDEVLENNNINFSKQSKENGIYLLSKLTLDTILKKLLVNNTKKHLCADYCSLDNFQNCDKVKYNHRKIETYDCIEEGIQVRTEDENGKLIDVNRFVVEKCKHSKVKK